MSKRNPLFKPPSLAQYFETPDDFVGCFGWICGYSADEGFLDDVAERFTRCTHAQRAYEGRIALALMLDPSNSQIKPTAVPGVLHLPIRGERPFRLLHAKVAILGFRHLLDGKQWRLRLIVSTGNWTRQTLEESLDLVWCVNLSNRELKSPDDTVARMCADFKAAWTMFRWLRSIFDTRALDSRPSGRTESESRITSRQFESWIERANRAAKKAVPHFFDNRDDSLLAQLPDMVRKHSSSSPRNYLAMGSGFFESPKKDDNPPPVLRSIVNRLQDAHMLTKHVTIDVFVNPEACQAVANSVRALHMMGWAVREPRPPDYLASGSRPRLLHAKFIFSAHERDNSAFCNSAWLYLGSGNLTGPGFANCMSPQGGNLEAGVVFAPEQLRWCDGAGVSDEAVVTNRLPLQWDTQFDPDTAPLKVGDDMPDPAEQFRAAPIPYLIWEADGDSGWLTTREVASVPFVVLDADSQVCYYDDYKGFHWLGAKPRQVQVRWGQGEQWRAWIPIIDEFGRVAATVLPRIDLDEAWSQLANFPMPPADEELRPDGDDEPGSSRDGPNVSASKTAAYPVRQMMQLIENIAAKQTVVSKTDWATWCTRLEQCLIQAAGSKALAEFRQLEINPLSPLRHTPFRPVFAESDDSNEGRRYKETLDRIEEAWNVTALAKIGGVE